MKDTPLRIALISEHASPLAATGGVDAGGQNIYVDQVARALASLGHHVDVLTRRDDPRLPPVVAAARRLRVLHVDAGPAAFVPPQALLPHMGAFGEAARRIAARAAADGRPYHVVHANFFMSGLVGLGLKRRFGLPLVTTFHGLGRVRREHPREADRFPAGRIGIEQRLVDESDRVIAECPQDEADLRHHHGADPSRIRVVPCGVDTGTFRPGDRERARRRLGLPADRFIVLQLGRLVPHKGIDTVVQAVARLHERDRAGPVARPVSLVIVGGGSREPDETVTPEIGRLRRLAAACGIEGLVHFAGQRPRDTLPDWYAAADVFATTPWYEPFGITPLEAMACGIPVVGSAVGGVRWTVADGCTGYLVPPRDPEALAARLARLREQPALADALGAAGVQRVRTLFTWDRVARSLLAVYREVVDDVREHGRVPMSPASSPRPSPVAAALGASMVAPAAALPAAAGG